jgi:hypothetical protein
MNPDCGLYEMYTETVSNFRKNPPSPGWDGVRKFTTK